MIFSEDSESKKNALPQDPSTTRWCLKSSSWAPRASHFQALGPQGASGKTSWILRKLVTAIRWWTWTQTKDTQVIIKYIMNIKYSWKHESSKALFAFFVWSLWKNLVYLLDMYTNFCFLLLGFYAHEDPKIHGTTWHPEISPSAAWRIPWKMSSLRILQDDTEAILRCLEGPLLTNYTYSQDFSHPWIGNPYNGI